MLRVYRILLGFFLGLQATQRFLGVFRIHGGPGILAMSGWLCVPDPARRRWPALPGHQRRAPTAAGCLFLARTQLSLPEDKPSPLATLVATLDTTRLPSLGAQCLNLTTSVLPASQEEGSGDYLGWFQRLLCHPGPGAGKPHPIPSKRFQHFLGSYSKGECWVQSS